MSNYNRYKKAGYDTREGYLNDLAVRYNINPMIISGLAEILGDEEDFDGLLSNRRYGRSDSGRLILYFMRK